MNTVVFSITFPPQYCRALSPMFSQEVTLKQNHIEDEPWGYPQVIQISFSPQQSFEWNRKTSADYNIHLMLYL